MKNWKYIEGAKTGNTAHSDKVEVIKRLLHANWSVQEIYELLKKEGYEVDKNFIERMKTGNESLGEYMAKKPRVINEDKTGAEEFFKKLSDDVKEREEKDDADIEKVGNETYQHKLYPDKYVIIEGKNYKIITDGKVEKTGVLTDAVLYGINQTYKRVGNSKWELPDGSTATVEDDGTIKIKKPRDSSIYTTKLWDKERAEKQLAQKGAKKVGNLQYHKVGKISIRLEANDDDWTVYDADGNELKSGKGGLGQAKTWAEHFARFTNKRTGNAKDKNDRDLKVGDVVDVRGKKGKITKIIGDVIEVFYDNRGTYNPDRTDRHYADEATKVGNRKLYWNTGTIDWDVANFNGQWYITMNGQKLKGPFPSMQEAERYLEGHKWELQGKYGNAKTGNKKLKFTSKTDGKIEYVYDEESQDGFIYDDGKLVDTIKGAGQGWLNLIKQKAFSSGVLNKTGNSAQDDKFAYVMREFDAGKLKTPDGKVVTDPAQAKAIAYSESKKTENGLARARKAMNKGITMWKGNDSAYIKEDGTVSYLENNSFETDKDKFESQESAIKELSKQGYVKK